MEEIKTDFGPGSELTSQHLNSLGRQVVQNANDVADAKAAAEAAQEAVNNLTDDSAEAKAQAQAAADAAAQVVSDLEANAQADAQVKAQVEANVEAIQANASKATQALDAIAANSEADAEVRALAEANKNLIEANAEADAQLATKVGNIEQDYVSKTDTKNAFKAQSLYNLVTYKYTDTDGSYSQVWNETSGGGLMYYDKTSDIKSFIGVNNGRESDDIWAQFYAKVVATNIGTRMNFTNHGVYMTIDKANGSYTEDDLLVTKKDIASFVSTDRLGGWVTIDGTLKNESVRKNYDNGNQNLWFCESDGSAFYTTDTKTKVRKCWATDARTDANRTPETVKNTDIDVISYCRVTEANDTIGFAANQGARLIGNVFGYYYTKNKTQSSDFDPEKDEIVTVGDIKSLVTAFLQTEEGKDIIKQIMQENGVVLGS